MPRRRRESRAQRAEYDLTCRAGASASWSSTKRRGKLLWMRRFQSVVANRASGGNTEMNGRGPSLQPVMAGAMEQVRDANRSRRGRRLNSAKQWMVVHNRVVKENFVDAAAAYVQRRGIIKAAPRAYARKKPIVLAVPESMRRTRQTRRCCR